MIVESVNWNLRIINRLLHHLTATSIFFWAVSAFKLPPCYQLKLLITKLLKNDQLLGTYQIVFGVHVSVNASDNECLHCWALRCIHVCLPTASHSHNSGGSGEVVLLTADHLQLLCANRSEHSKPGHSLLVQSFLRAEASTAGVQRDQVSLETNWHRVAATSKGLIYALVLQTLFPFQHLSFRELISAILRPWNEFKKRM